MSLINYCFSNVFKQNIEKENLALEGETPNGVPEIRVKKPSFDIVYDGNHTRISSYFNDSKAKADLEKALYLICNEEPEKNEDSIDLGNNSIFYSFESFVYKKSAIYKLEDLELGGVLFCTNYRLFFMPDKCESSFQHEFFSIPLLMIIKLDKSKFFEKKYSIDLISKDNKNLKFIISDDENSILFDYINGKAFHNDIKAYYSLAYEFKKRNNSHTNGWDIFDPIKEFQRQGLDLKSGNSKLRLCEANINFTICDTYPEKFVVPRFFSDDEINEAKSFRTKNRLPVFCWINNDNKASLWRSSQTKSGLTHQRSNKDEQLLKMIGDYSQGLIIYDARPYYNAIANRFKGAGFENTDYYKNTEIKFCEIENIHAVRNSLEKVYSLCRNHNLRGIKKFHSLYEQSGWSDYISLLLKTVSSIVHSIQVSNSTVLIHCSDGWDRTTQLVSLTEIFLDPYYRTIKGFIVLIEKEWLSYGHQFGLRNGIYASETKKDQSAPIFLQWLDCLHQIILQNPSSFEFNMNLLLFLAFHHQNCLYGTFIFNNEKERKEMDYKATESIWSVVLEKIEVFRNSYYWKNNEPLCNNYSSFKLRFWEEYFLINNYDFAIHNGNINFHDHIIIQTFINSFEVQKKEDKLLIQNQKKEENELKNLFKEIYKFGFIYDLQNQLPVASRGLLKQVISSDDDIMKLPIIDENYFKLEENNKDI